MEMLLDLFINTLTWQIFFFLVLKCPLIQNRGQTEVAETLPISWAPMFINGSFLVF